MSVQFDIKKISVLKEMFLRLRHDASPEAIQEDFNQHFKDVNIVDILLIELKLLTGDFGITIEDAKRFTLMHPQLEGSKMNEKEIPTPNHPSHPVQLFKEENTAFQVVFDHMQHLLASFEEDPSELQNAERVEELKGYVFQLGVFHNHYNRKEKLFFPIMERYGRFNTTRTVWGLDDQIRVLYQSLKGQVSQLPDVKFTRIQKRFDELEKEFKAMIFIEEEIILPVLQSLFSEKDWRAVANESDAFGYAMIEAPEENWTPELGALRVSSNENKEVSEGKSARSTTESLVFGGGYLTIEEANLILNNLPLEITFIDRNGMFKYFNEMTEASEMMLVRTPSSIGRNVANCHPPKSLMKVMTIIRDLKTGKRTSESMWFKKKDEYIHITYKAIFNEGGEFLGVLEYVQDIQPFFELPTKVKTGISNVEN